MRRALILAIVLLIPPTAAIMLSDIAETMRYPRRYAEAVPGRVFRGGFPSAEEILHLQRDKHIQTVVSLTGPTDRSREGAMLAMISRLGLRHLRFPMPGNGAVADYDLLDRAADAVADPSNQPVFYHCAAGKQRSNTVLGAYRLKHCGWTFDEVLQELTTQYDLDPKNESEICDCLRGYAKWLKAGGRATAESAE